MQKRHVCILTACLAVAVLIGVVCFSSNTSTVKKTPNTTAQNKITEQERTTQKSSSKSSSSKETTTKKSASKSGSASNGDKTCNECSGTGKTKCTWCNGTGKQEAAGTKYTCPSCSGTGKMNCLRCLGKGKIHTHSESASNAASADSYAAFAGDMNPYGYNSKQLCSVCSGTGSKPCPSCHGAGKLYSTKSGPNYGYGSSSYQTATTCYACHGSGRVNCTACFGKGTIG